MTRRDLNKQSRKTFRRELPSVHLLPFVLLSEVTRFEICIQDNVAGALIEKISKASAELPCQRHLALYSHEKSWDDERLLYHLPQNGPAAAVSRKGTE